VKEFVTECRKDLNGFCCNFPGEQKRDLIRSSGSKIEFHELEVTWAHGQAYTSNTLCGYCYSGGGEWHDYELGPTSVYEKLGSRTSFSKWLTDNNLPIRGSINFTQFLIDTVP